MALLMQLNSSIPDPRDHTLSFIDSDSAKEFDCSICLQIVLDPVDIGCDNGHIFCNVCIARLVTNKNHFLCPSCRCMCKVDNIRKMPFIQRQILKLKVLCRNHDAALINQLCEPQDIHRKQHKRDRDRPHAKKKKSHCCITVPGMVDHYNSSLRSRSRSRSRSRERNTNVNNAENTEEENKQETDDKETKSVACEWEGSWGDLYDHLRHCEYEILPCNHCGIPCIRKELEQHYSACAAYPLQCHKCRKLVKRSQLNIHLEIACPKVETVCICGETLLREAQPMHCEHVCPESKLKCHYAIYGCSAMIRRKDMGKHLKSNMEQHLALVTQQCDHLSHCYLGLMQRVRQIEEHLDLNP